MKLKPFATAATIGLAGALGVPHPADAQAPAPAQAAPPAAPAPAAAAAPSTAMDLGNGISMSGHVEAGTTINTDSPANNTNFGQTFNDRDNTFRMNQAMLNIERDLDPKNAGWQWGFKFTGMYGTDARVTHFYGEFDRVTHSPYQWDIVELDAQAHVPWIGGGTDVKLGQYPTPIGYEVIDATGNPFYSHSMIFFYGIPYKHTGLLTTTHVNETLDLWLGLDTGVNDSIGSMGQLNNEFPKALLGFGLNNLMDGNLTILALAHIGPEASAYAQFANAAGQPLGGPTCSAAGGPVCGALFVPGANNKVLQIYDTIITYKISDSLTSTTELNYIKSDILEASGGGVATYLSYALNDQWTLNGRAEAFEDQNGAFVTEGTESLDYVNGPRGLLPVGAYFANIGSGRAAFNDLLGEITLGATYKPAVSDKFNVMIRPEVRFDSLIGGTSGIKPYDVNSMGVGTKTSQITLAADLIVGF